MSHPGQHARLGHRVSSRNPANAAYGDMLLPEGAQQETPRLVVTDHADGQHRHSQVSQVVNGIAGSARHDRPLAMAQDQYGSLARDTRYFTVDELVRDQIAEHRDAEFGELFDNPDQAVRRFSVLLHSASEIFSCPG